MKNAVKRRNYYACEMVLESPLCIMSGEHNRTDMDVLRNGSGEPFIPGTSIAGAFRGYLDSREEQEEIMGYTRERCGRMSALSISDLYFNGKTVVSVRDGIRLNSGKTVDADGKFDQEIIETGASAMLYMSGVAREGNETMDFDQIVTRFLLAVDKGEIRFGARKNRGFGKFRIENVYDAMFDASRAEGWLKFLEAPRDIASYPRKCKFQEWSKAGEETWTGRYVFLTVPLRLTGGISIRRYSMEPNQADYEQITCNGSPVIPGSSWTGLIRSAAGEILAELGCTKGQVWLEQWFGYVKKEEALQSMVVIGESVLNGAQRLPMTRNQIDRFDGSSKSGALYTEISWFGGEARLKIGVKKDPKKNYMALLGLLLLVIRDIQEGYAAVGGQTAVGRGIFASDGEIEYSEEISKLDCERALMDRIRKEGLGCDSGN